MTSTRHATSDALRGATIAATLVGTTVTSGARAALRRRPVTAGFANGTVNGMERLGPTFVKFGQLIASSPGLFPEPLSDACRRCLDRVPPVPAADIRAVIEADLGAPISALFADFDDVPLSAASIAQVHACTLPDGRRAVVKVQRPGIASKMLADLRIMRAAAQVVARSRRFAVANPVGIVDDLRSSTINELDLQLEAARHTRVRDALQTFGDNQDVTAPEGIAAGSVDGG